MRDDNIKRRTLEGFMAVYTAEQEEGQLAEFEGMRATHRDEHALKLAARESEGYAALLKLAAL